MHPAWPPSLVSQLLVRTGVVRIPRIRRLRKRAVRTRYLQNAIESVITGRRPYRASRIVRIGNLVQARG
jgi:hypothetical protein